MKHNDQNAPLLNPEIDERLARLTQELDELKRYAAAVRNRTGLNGPERLPLSARIFDLLATAKGGLPGRLTTAELIKATGESKSAVHYHIGVLESAGQVHVMRGPRSTNGRRGPDVVFHRDAILT